MAIIFRHPQGVEKIPGFGPLVIDTGVNEMFWDYKLNVQTYPTYAGEVVQILSCYVDNITMQGDVDSYAKMEEIYRWFLAYMQVATQGKYPNNEDTSGSFRYIEDPVQVHYQERGWNFFIKPIELPGLNYGLDVVVPQWQLVAVMAEDNDQNNAIALHTISKISEAGIDQDTEIALTGQIGFSENNPFVNPDAAPLQQAKQGGTGIENAAHNLISAGTANPHKQTKPTSSSLQQRVQDEANKVADWFINIVNAYGNQDFSALGLGSVPASSKTNSSTPNKSGTTPGSPGSSGSGNSSGNSGAPARSADYQSEYNRAWAYMNNISANGYPQPRPSEFGCAAVEFWHNQAAPQTTGDQLQALNDAFNNWHNQHCVNVSSIGL